MVEASTMVKVKQIIFNTIFYTFLLQSPLSFKCARLRYDDNIVTQYRIVLQSEYYEYDPDGLI